MGESRVVGELASFEDFARSMLILDSGQPFVVEPFQRTMLEPFYGAPERA